MANGPDLPGELFVEGERVDLKREYLNKTDLNRALSEIPPRLFDASVPFDPYRTAILAQPATVLVGVPAGKAGTRAVTTTVHNPNEVAASRDLEIGRRLERIQASVSSAQQNLVRDVQQLEATNASIKQLNSQVMPVLNAVTGEDFADRADDWKSWWADQRGLVYDVPSTPRVKPVLTQVVPNSTQASISHSCFGAGTLVRTNKGLRPIESIQLGDQVLAQDTKSGRLFYTPVVAVFHNRPTSTFRVRLGNESVVATGIHRFWKAGAGWVMARDLKPGDPVRTLGGTVSVTSVETDEVQPVFNLEVADASSYFVSQTGVLVHDNSTVWPVAHPFDAAPVIASAMGR